jgi:hypothetical protein
LELTISLYQGGRNDEKRADESIDGSTVFLLGRSKKIFDEEIGLPPSLTHDRNNPNGHQGQGIPVHQ